MTSSCSVKPSGYGYNGNKRECEFSTIIFIDNISRSQFIVFNSYHIMTYTLYVYVYVYLYIYAINICCVMFSILISRYLGSMRASKLGAAAVLSRQYLYILLFSVCA